MTAVLEPAGRGVELSLSWLRNDLTTVELTAAFRSEAFLPLYDSTDWSAFKAGESSRQSNNMNRQPLCDSRWQFDQLIRGLYIGRAQVGDDWRIGTVYWKRWDIVEEYQLQHKRQHQQPPCQSKRTRVPPMLLAGTEGTWVTHSYEILRPSSISSFLGRPHRWVPWRGCGEAPLGAVVAGCECDQPLYIARAMLEGRPTAGEFAPHRGAAYFACNPPIVGPTPRDGVKGELKANFDVLMLAERSVHPDIAKVFRV